MAISVLSEGVDSSVLGTDQYARPAGKVLKFNAINYSSNYVVMTSCIVSIMVDTR